MGTVFLAVRLGPAGFNKLDVVKQLLPSLAADPERLEGFLYEARLAARLNHPNIVQTNEVGFDGSHYFIEMEYLEGETLDAILKRPQGAKALQGPLGMWVLAEVLAGLHYAHELTDIDGQPLGVVHRDVSPHNVMVTHEGAVKVLDFGIAKAADATAHTETGTVKGKLRYMAPEQALTIGSGRASEKLDRRADVFSVGTIMWQMLVGRRLWEDLPDGEVFHRLSRGEIDPPSRQRPEVPPELDAICVRALRPDPADRFPTAAAFRTALEGWLDEHAERVGPRHVVDLMTALFAEHRAKVKTQIDTRVQAVRRAVDAGASASVPPPLAPPGSSSSLDLGMRTHTEDARQPRRRWPIPLAGVAVAVAAASIVTLSWRSSHGPGLVSAPPPCRANADCIKRGSALSVCRSADGTCVALESGDCHVVANPGDVEDDRTLWIGTMFPTSGREGELYGTRVARSTELARRDFDAITHGIPSHRPGEAPRPLGLIACDDTADPGRVARHLATDVRVPAVVGFHSSQEVIDLASMVFIPNQTMAMATINHSDLITSIPHPPGVPRLVWRTAVSTSQNAPAVGTLVGQVVEPALRAKKVVGRDQPIRVALLRPDNNVGLSFADALFRALHFNGKSAMANGADFAEIDYGDLRGAQRQATIDRAVRTLLDLRPHVVIAMGDGVPRQILLPLEQQWPHDAPFHPRYVMPASIRGNGVESFIGGDVDRLARLVGVGAPVETMPNTRFTMHFNETFHDDAGPADALGGAYDAIYLIAYAAYAAGDAPPTGADLARAMSRLAPPGAPVEAGPAKILEAFRVLGLGGNIVLEGATRRFEFDPATGEAPTDILVLCPKMTEKGLDEVASGMTYRSASQTLEGTFHCW